MTSTPTSLTARPHPALEDPLRLLALRRAGLLDAPPEPRFDELTRVAAEQLEARVSLVSLVTADRQFFASCVGLPEPWASRRGTPLSHSFCQHVVVARDELVIEDARAHPLVRDNAAIVDLGVVAYAGVPVRAPDGQVLGSFCVIDAAPRRWTERDLRLVRALAQAVSEHIALHDATREAQARLREMEASYRDVVDTLDEIVFAVDLGGRWTWLSPAWTHVTGYAVEDSLGQAFLDYVYPDDRAGNAAVFDPLIAGITNDYRHLMRYVHADGTVRWLGARARAVRDAGNAVVGAFGALNDVTARVNAEHALRDREEELARARKLEAVGRLAAGIAHDFNNLLTAVSAHAQFLREELPEAPAADLDGIADAVRRGESLTRQLLAVSARQSMRPEHVDLNEVAQGMARLLERVLGAGVRLETRLAPDLPALHVDRSQLEQVLLNLLVNARDALPAGGDVLLATARGALPDGRAGVVLTVRDAGTGMDAHTREHLFEPFFTTKEPGQGTGLGLATVHGIVTQWGGRVEVESALGVGSEFRVILPVSGEW